LHEQLTYCDVAPPAAGRVTITYANLDKRCCTHARWRCRWRRRRGTTTPTYCLHVDLTGRTQ